MCDLSAALVSALRNKKGDAAISAAAEKNKKEDAGLANIGNGLIAPRSQLGFGTVPKREGGSKVSKALKTGEHVKQNRPALPFQGLLDTHHGVGQSEGF